MGFNSGFKGLRERNLQIWGREGKGREGSSGFGAASEPMRGGEP